LHDIVDDSVKGDSLLALSIPGDPTLLQSQDVRYVVDGPGELGHRGCLSQGVLVKGLDQQSHERKNFIITEIFTGVPGSPLAPRGEVRLAFAQVVGDRLQIGSIHLIQVDPDGDDPIADIMQDHGEDLLPPGIIGPGNKPALRFPEPLHVLPNQHLQLFTHPFPWLFHQFVLNDSWKVPLSSASVPRSASR
jgi:hypothetical protein